MGVKDTGIIYTDPGIMLYRKRSTVYGNIVF